MSIADERKRKSEEIHRIAKSIADRESMVTNIKAIQEKYNKLVEELDNLQDALEKHRTVDVSVVRENGSTLHYRCSYPSIKKAVIDALIESIEAKIDEIEDSLYEALKEYERSAPKKIICPLKEIENESKNLG